MQIIRSSNVRIIIDDINKVEVMIGHDFPEEYRNFLLVYNGGYPDKSIFAIPGQGESLLGKFYGINVGDRDDLLLVNDIFIGRIRCGFLSIASDQCGNQICISIRKCDYGKIFFWDHEYEGTGVDMEYILISESLVNFFNSLK